MRDDIEFSRDLIKGKIAEIVFEQMFREAGEFTILRLGYEYTSPELAQYRNHFEVKQVLDHIKSTPDFALVSHDKKRVFIVEVKYRTKWNDSEFKKIAVNTLKYADPSWLFIATPEAFYFDTCHNVDNHEGDLNRLSAKWIPKDIQAKYLNLLKEFEVK